MTILLFEHERILMTLTQVVLLAMALVIVYRVVRVLGSRTGR